MEHTPTYKGNIPDSPEMIGRLRKWSKNSLRVLNLPKPKHSCFPSQVTL